MKNKRMIFKLFLSYILLVIPMLGINFVVTNFIITDMREQVDERIQRKSSEIVQTLDGYLINYRDKSVKLSTIKQLSKEKMILHDYKTSSGIEYLDNICMMDEFIDDILLYYDGNIYKTNGYCRLQTWLNTTVGCDETYAGLSEALFEEKQMSTLYLKGSNNAYLLLHYPIEGNRNVNAASINYCIRMNELYSLMKPLSEQLSVGIKITLHNLYQTENIYLMGNMEDEIQEIDQRSFDILVDKKKVFKAESSEFLGMKIQVFYDAGEIYQQVLLWKRVSGWCMGVFWLVSFFVSYKISTSHYQKIYQLKQSIESYRPQNEIPHHNKRENDFDVMWSMIQSIGAETDRMKAERNSVREKLKQHAAMLLCYGGINDEKNIWGILESCGIEQQNPFSCVVCIALDGENDVYPLWMEKLVLDNLGFFSDLEFRKTLVVLLGLPDEDFFKKYRGIWAQKILQEDRGEGKIKVAFSRVYNSLLYAPNAYLEATGICRKLLSAAKQAIGYIDTVIDTEEFEREIKVALMQVNKPGSNENKISFANVVEYINSNYYRYDLSLEEVAEYAGLSTAYMSRLFKEKTGSRYIEYLAYCRMEHAKKLLEETKLGIKDIAVMVGYNNVPLFRNKFKEYYGITASEYRKQHQCSGEQVE